MHSLRGWIEVLYLLQARKPGEERNEKKERKQASKYFAVSLVKRKGGITLIIQMKLITP